MRRRNWGRIISPVTVFCGIAGWADKSLIDSKLFYPLSVKSSIDRLRFYASQFPLVEVDSTYYGIPKPETVESWAAQTPAGFTFDVKAFSLFTNHPTRPLSLPRDIPYVAVDVPEGHATSMPSVFDVTSPKLAVVRFHGRNHETWDLRGVPPNVRFRYDYSEEELGQWVPRIKEMERSASRVHALMNNNYSNYSVKNAQQLERLLDAWQM